MIRDFLAPRRLGHRGQILAISTVLPGMVLLVEFVLLTLPSEAYGDVRDFVQFVAKATADISLLGAIIILAIGTLLGLILGVVSRLAVFRVLDWREKKRWAHLRLRSSEIIHALKVVYGDTNVGTFLDRHPIGNALASQAREAALDHDKPKIEFLIPPDVSDSLAKSIRDSRRSNLDTWRGYVFAYAKHRLRATNPTMSVDYDEFEINLLFGLIPPLLLLFPVVVRWILEADVFLIGSVASIVVSTVVIGLAIRTHWTSARETKLKEHERALRFLFFSEWIRDAEAVDDDKGNIAN